MACAATTVFLSTDLRGSTRVARDADGKRLVWFGYDPFGASVLSACGGDAGLIDRLTRRYTGQVFEQESGLYHYGARLYDEALARFVSVDPRYQTPSPYSYCGNDPVDRIDPDGCANLLVIEYRDAWYLFTFNSYVGEISIHDAKHGSDPLRTTPFVAESDASAGWRLKRMPISHHFPDEVREQIEQATSDVDRKRIAADYLTTRSIRPEDLSPRGMMVFEQFIENVEGQSLPVPGVIWPVRTDINSVLLVAEALTPNQDVNAVIDAARDRAAHRKSFRRSLRPLESPRSGNQFMRAIPLSRGTLKQRFVKGMSVRTKEAIEKDAPLDDKQVQGYFARWSEPPRDMSKLGTTHELFATNTTLTQHYTDEQIIQASLA